jgi:hypothetical protein
MTTICRRRQRTPSSSSHPSDPPLSPSSSISFSSHDQEVHPDLLTASSDTRLLWPLTLFHAANVLDRSDGCWWNSGTFPPATLRLQLHGGPASLTRMALQVEMLPATARVRHEIRVGLSADTMRTACWFEGVVSSREWIRVSLDCALQGVGDAGDTEALELRRRRVRFIEVVTHESPSYVAWRRIRVWQRGP